MKNLVFICMVIFALLSCSKKSGEDLKNGPKAGNDISASEISLPAEDAEDFETLMARVPSQELPFRINTGVLEKIDTALSYTSEQESVLHLDWLDSASGTHFKTIPMARVSLSKRFLSLIVMQWYTEESLGWLVNYAPDDGSVIDMHQIFYDNSEGSTSTWSEIESAGSILIHKANIYEDEGEETVDTAMVDTTGKIFLKDSLLQR